MTEAFSKLLQKRQIIKKQETVVEALVQNSNYSLRPDNEKVFLAAVYRKETDTRNEMKRVQILLKIAERLQHLYKVCITNVEMFLRSNNVEWLDPVLFHGIAQPFANRLLFRDLTKDLNFSSPIYVDSTIIGYEISMQQCPLFSSTIDLLSLSNLKIPSSPCDPNLSVPNFDNGIYETLKHKYCLQDFMCFNRDFYSIHVPSSKSQLQSMLQDYRDILCRRKEIVDASCAEIKERVSQLQMMTTFVEKQKNLFDMEPDPQSLLSLIHSGSKMLSL